MADLTINQDTLTAILAELTRIREHLEAQDPAGHLLTAAEVAQRFGVARDWIYSNQDRLGAIRLPSPTGERPRLRFDPATVQAALTDKPEPSSIRRRRNPVELLPIGNPTTQKGNR